MNTEASKRLEDFPDEEVLERAEAIKKRKSDEYLRRAEEIDRRVADCERLKGTPFTDSELLYSAFSRCDCGAGMAYPKDCGMHHSWRCSAILTGRAERGSSHSSPLPFAFYEVKSENQPSANGATTRPAAN